MLSSRSTQAKAAKVEGVEQLNRACEPCRLLKVRCLPDPQSQSGICQRCSKSGRTCVFTPPQKRRQRIRTDTRVAELEREVRAMRALLNKGGVSGLVRSQEDVTTGDVDDSRQSPSSPLTEHKLGNTSESGQSLQTSQPRTPDDSLSLSTTTSYSNDQGPSPSSKDSVDFLGRGLISQDTAYEMFESYINDLLPLYPAVVFPTGYTASAARKEKPVLFAAVVTAASCQLDPALFSSLFNELLRVYAERIFVNGEKSLELVQAMSVTSIWNCPPDVGEMVPLKFFQHINLTASMAVDIGLGTSVDGSAASVEECRTILACYLACAGVAMRMRRPNMLRWTSVMSNCLQVLELSPAATLHDKRFAAWVKLQNIADEYLEGTAGVDESRLQLLLKSFERRMENWKTSISPEVMNVSLELVSHQNSIYFYEAVFGGADPLDFNHMVFNVKESDPSSAEKPLSVPRRPMKPLSVASITAITACIESSHAHLDAFLSIDVRTLQVSSIVVYVRASYALVVLIKLFVSARDASSELSKILDPWSLKIGTYLPAVIERITQAASPKRLRIPTKWLSILAHIDIWYRYHESSSDSEKANPQLPIGDFKPHFEGACEFITYPMKHQNSNLLPLIKESETPAEPPPPDSFPIPSGAIPQDILSNLPQQDPASSMPELDAVSMTFDQSEGDLTAFGAPIMAALDPNDWFGQSNGIIGLDMNWDPAAQDWSYDLN